MIPQTNSTPSFRQRLATPHLHTDGDACPTCEQVIPPEKLEEIKGKIAKKEFEREQAIKAAIESKHSTEMAQAEVKAKGDLENERKLSAAREAAAREEARKEAERIAAEKLSAISLAQQETLTALQSQIEQSETARKAAEQAGVDLREELKNIREENAAALANIKAEAATREAAIRSEAREAADKAVAEKISGLELAHKDSEVALQKRIDVSEQARLAEQQKGTALQTQLDETLKANEAALQQIKDAAAAEAVRIRQEATQAAEERLRIQLTEKDQVVADAQAKAVEAEDKFTTLTARFDTALNEQLASQREILEKAKDEALSVEKAKAFEETLKLSNKVSELQRALEKKTNEELGEGAEIDLYEALKKEFPDDHIERVAKGAPGADIIHVVLLNGKECGKIIYDSKNHKAFRADHVTKLRTDQLAARAEHAILSLQKFPAGYRQLHEQEGVLLVNPARVVAVVGVLRQHLLQIHTLQMSSAERESKMGALYAFITSERCAQLFARVDGNAEELLKQQVAEKRQHEAAWKKEGELIRSIQKVQADLTNEISCIIGTAAEPEPRLEDLL